jgi:hypothetical protein
LQNMAEDGEHETLGSYFKSAKEDIIAWFLKPKNNGGYNLFFRKLTAHLLILVLVYFGLFTLVSHFTPMYEAILQNIYTTMGLASSLFIWERLIKNFLPEKINKVVTGEFVWTFNSVEPVNQIILIVLIFYLLIFHESIQATYQKTVKQLQTYI